jgi:hypothetical protein
MKLSLPLVPLFSLTLFTSALLLFWVEPMFGKMVLPLLGGAPSIWITAMLFYQVALLAGYAYAHATSRWLKPLPQMALHLGFMLLAFSVLPVAVPPGWVPPAEANPVPWLLKMLTVALGAPFIVLAATAPMMQRWFSATRHPQAENPYFLYAVSNAGSFAGLFAYPLLLEPLLTLADQSRAWSGGFIALFALVVLSAAGAQAFRRGKQRKSTRTVTEKKTPWPVLLRWLVLSAAPSSLLLSVTTFITTDVAAIPFLWVLPLALYLLTFIIAFSSRPLITSRFALWLQPFLLAPLCIALIPVLGQTGISPIVFLPVHLAVFFFSALICHFELVRLKPEAQDLTRFYLVMSLGGALGGAFNVLIAPVLFNDVYEYPLGLMLVCLLRPWPREGIWRWKAVVACALGAAALMTGAAILGQPTESSSLFYLLGYKLAIAAAAFLLFFTRRHPLWLGLGLGTCLVATMAVPGLTSLITADRNFFGVIRVRDFAGGYRILEHGTTIHGLQARDPAYEKEPLSYYSRYGGMGEALTALGRKKAAPHVAIIGLGVGSLVCYGSPQWRFTLYEIDPAVARVAQDPALFTFLSACKSRQDIVLGDGRLAIARASEGSFDLIVLDAFSSDVIPVHLVTQEAISLYLEKLAPGGMIVLHLSNRYLYLSPTVAAIARNLELAALERIAPGGTIEGTALPYYGSIVVALGRKPRDLKPLARMEGWKPLVAGADVAAWTDDYSNLLQPFLRRRNLMSAGADK